MRRAIPVIFRLLIALILVAAIAATAAACDTKAAVNQLWAEWNGQGFVELNAIWDTTFDEHIMNSVAGDQLSVGVGTVEARQNELMVFDENGKPVGAVLNRFQGCNNIQFREIIIEFMQAKSFPVTLANIDSDSGSGRIGFRIRIY